MSLDDNIFIGDNQRAGFWANKVNIQYTEHEFSIDFIRMDPDWEEGVVVARISFSPTLAMYIIDELGSVWQSYVQKSMPKEARDGDA